MNREKENGVLYNNQHKCMYHFRILTDLTYEEALAACDCPDGPELCGLATGAEMWEFNQNGVPDELDGLVLRVNAIKVTQPPPPPAPQAGGYYKWVKQ
jgi:hypothetical protein